MPELPTDTLAFLFTDIEGGTNLWERHSEALRATLGRHDAVLREVIEGHNGGVASVVEVTVGDA